MIPTTTSTLLPYKYDCHTPLLYGHDGNSYRQPQQRVPRLFFSFLTIIVVVVLRLGGSGGGGNNVTLVVTINAFSTTNTPLCSYIASSSSTSTSASCKTTSTSSTSTSTSTNIHIGAVRHRKHLAVTIVARTKSTLFHLYHYQQRHPLVPMDMTHYNDDDGDDDVTRTDPEKAVSSTVLLSTNDDLLISKVFTTNTNTAATLLLTIAATAASNITSSSTTSTTPITNTFTLDRILSQLTLGFPFFVVVFAMMGVLHPTTLLWINKGNRVTVLLALVMFGTGLTLQKSDFRQIWDTKMNRYSVLLGVLCQFIIMPTTAYIVGRIFFLSHLFIPSCTNIMDVSAAAAAGGGGSTNIASALFLGLCFVGCSPGGTASNVVTYIANANVALSVVLTSCSTFAAVVVTPLLMQLLLRNTIYGSHMIAAPGATGMIGTTPTIQISGWSLCTSTAKVVCYPLLWG